MTTKVPVVWFDQTDAEREAIKKLSRCKFGAFNQADKFVQQLAKSDRITPRQRQWLDRLIMKHKTQMGFSDEGARMFLHRVQSSRPNYTPEKIEWPQPTIDFLPSVDRTSIDEAATQLEMILNERRATESDDD